MPAAAVIPTLLVYFNVAAFKTFVVYKVIILTTWLVRLINKLFFVLEKKWDLAMAHAEVKTPRDE